MKPRVIRKPSKLEEKAINEQNNKQLRIASEEIPKMLKGKK